MHLWSSSQEFTCTKKILFEPCKPTSDTLRICESEKVFTDVL